MSKTILTFETSAGKVTWEPPTRLGPKFAAKLQEALSLPIGLFFGILHIALRKPEQAGPITVELAASLNTIAEEILARARMSDLSSIGPSPRFYSLWSLRLGPLTQPW